MTCDEFSNALRLLMNETAHLPAKAVLWELEGVIAVLRREAQFDAHEATDKNAERESK